MKTIATHEAKTHLSRYLSEVSAGETIVITRGRTPLAKLVPYVAPTQEPRPRVGQAIDARMAVPDEAFAPLDADQLKEWGL
jgi:prevent-host-death family protein